MSIALRSTAGTLGIVALVALGACGGQPDAEGGDTAAGSTDRGAMGMDSMPGMQGMQGDGMMARMTSHMQVMQSANADSLSSMMPMHRQMVANMLSTMNREMRSMNMPGDAAWNATMDSVRRDLATMPELSAAQLQDLMPEHRARVMRLLEMHQAMMKDMDM